MRERIELERSSTAFPRVLLVLFTLLVVTAAACGTRVPREDIVAAAGGGARDGVTPGDDTRQREDLTGESPSALTPGGQGGASRDRGTSEAVGGSAGAAASHAETNAGQGTGSDSNAQGSENAPGGEASGAPIKIGSVSNLSGIIGAAHKPAVFSTRVWVRWINDQGGINGHPVEYFVVDNQGDPAKHRAAVEDMVENKGVIAIVSQWTGTADEGSRSYHEENQVPVIGGSGTPFWYDSPMYFPQRANKEDTPWLIWKVQSRFASAAEGTTKAATLVCVEGDSCTGFAKDSQRYAPEHGFELVYQGQGSLGQPDFTSECLQMRNAGVEVVVMWFDAATINRIADSCARQDYFPRYGLDILTVGGAEAAKRDVFQGSALSAFVFPWIGGDTPAAQEYLNAFATFAPGEQLEPGHAEGWAAAKMFEKAAQTIGPGEEPTTAAILEGLWAFEDDTVGGLISGLTFRRGQPPKVDPGCRWAMIIRDRQWVLPDGMEPTCR